MSGTVKKVGAAVFWSVFARGGRFALGLVSSIIVVRGLGDYDWGVLSLLRSVLSFVIVIAGVGLGQSLLKFLPVLRVAQDAAGARRLLQRIVVVQLIVWVAMLVIAYAARDMFASVFPIDGIGGLFVAVVALALFELFFTLLSDVLNANYDTKLLSAATIASHVTFIVVVLVLFDRGMGVMGVLVAAAVGHLVAFVMILSPVSRHMAGGIEQRDNAVSAARLLRFSLPFALIGILKIIVWRQSETLFLAHYRGLEETGYFDLAYRLPQLLLEFVPGTIWPIIMAGVSEAYARNTDSLSHSVTRYYKMLFLLSTPICLVGIALGGRMIPILYGQQMASAALPTQVFFAIFTVSFLATPLSMVLYVVEKTHVNLLIYMFLAVVNVGLDFILIPRYGIAGAMVPVALVILLQPVIYKRVVGRYVDGITIPFSFIGKCFLASSPVLLLLLVAGHIDNVWTLAAAALFAAAVVTAGVKKLKLIGPEESDMLGSIPVPGVSRFVKFLST